MKSDDLQELSSLELMRRIAALLPANDTLRADLNSVIAGLSTPDTWSMVDGEIRDQTDFIPKARTLLQQVLSRLAAALPNRLLTNAPPHDTCD